MTAVRPDDDVALVDLLDRLLAGGVMITGDVTISLADVELVHVSLRLLLSSVRTLLPYADGGSDGVPDTGIALGEPAP